MKKKEVDEDRASLLHDISMVAKGFGYRDLSPAVLEKDLLSVEALSALGLSLVHGDYQPVLHGATSLNKMDVPLKRISDNIDIRLVRSAVVTALNPEQAHKDVIIMVDIAADTFKKLGYGHSGIDIQRSEDGLRATIHAYYKSHFDPDPALIEPIEIRLNGSPKNPQGSYVTRPITCIADTWLPKTLKSDYKPIFCSSVLMTIAEKLIAFPRRYAEHLRRPENNARRDPNLVKHLYDICMLRTSLNLINETQSISMLKIMTQSVILKDQERAQAQHPEFVVDANNELIWAMYHADTSDALAKDYEDFVDRIVYVSDDDVPDFQYAVRSFGTLLSQCLDTPTLRMNDTFYRGLH